MMDFSILPPLLREHFIAILIGAPIFFGVLAWSFDVRGVREALGLIGALIPLVLLGFAYSTIFRSPIGAIYNVSGYPLHFELSPVSWYFAFITSLIGLTTALGMVSTSRRGYDWLFALMSYTGVLGVFLSRDFVGFFLLWELMTFASFMMVLKYDRGTSLKYFVLSIIGAYAMLLAIAILYTKTGHLDFGGVARGIMLLMSMNPAAKGSVVLVFVLFLLAFGVKAGAFPLHVWAPGAYSETEDSYRAFFSGVLSKAGAYGFYLIYILMGYALYVALGQWRGYLTFSYLIAWIGAVTVVVPGFLAVLQEDVRKLLAYSSVSQVGYILLAFGTGTALGFVGAFFHVLSHALFKALFWLVTAALILRTGKTRFEDFGGLAEKMPVTFAMALIAIMSLAGIPPLAGFASKWLIYEAAINAHMPLVAGAIFLGSGIAFAYVVRFLYAIWFGQRPSDLDDVREAPLPLLLGMGILGVLNLVFGVAPGLVTDVIQRVLGMRTPIVRGTYFKLVTPNGTYDALTVTLMLVIGLVIAGLLFLYGARARKVPITETYQSGNPVTEEYNFNIRRNFYRPLAEALEFWLRYSWDRFYERLAGIAEDFGDLLRNSVYNGNVQSYSWYLALILLILALWGVL